MLFVDGVKVFDGKFRMSGIDTKAYKGNLVVPTAKTIKEIFGDKKMNQIEGLWDFDFKAKAMPPKEGEPQKEPKIKGMATIISETNTAKGITDCIFPYALYGLIPKHPQPKPKPTKPVKPGEEDEKTPDIYSAKDESDDSSRLGLEDFAPSINCLRAIKNIFANSKIKTRDGKEKHLKIGGTAFADEALKNLYMSYRNPSDYQQEWNWGHLGQMRLKGSWTNYEKKLCENNRAVTQYEHNFHINDKNNRIVYVADILKGRMCKIDYENSYDNGNNIIQTEAVDIIKKPFTQTHILIPASGLYKIHFKGSILINNEKNRSS